jgi:lipid II:glycine glycyltransferase (peptidoglycan interpeptide bridge formation enzyme)
MDITPSLKDLYEGMRPHWKRELKIAERKGLEIVAGTGDELFQAVMDIHREMVARKKFKEGNDINQFRFMQAQLPDNLKMRVMICKSAAGICAGTIWSAIGNMGLYLFGATSSVGLKSNGSYLLQWKLIEQLKKEGLAVYDLNGINPEMNPGTYKFKNDLAGKHGRDVWFAGQFESHANFLTFRFIKGVEACAGLYRRVNAFLRAAKAC